MRRRHTGFIRFTSPNYTKCSLDLHAQHFPNYLPVHVLHFTGVCGEQGKQRTELRLQEKRFCWKQFHWLYGVNRLEM